MRWRRSRATTYPLLGGLLFGLATTGGAQDDERLRELLYGEALFYSQQQDYAAAISHLQLAEDQGLLPSSPENARLLLARMKLAYGMHLEAGFDLHALPDSGTTTPEKNRAWYELGRAFYNKGYSGAAMEALTQVQGDLPEDVAGDYQLLRATLLMSLGQNREAAQELAQWRPPPELAAYAYYNRGIALLRADDRETAVPMLEKAVAMPAKTEELLALRDKARLSLGYIFASGEKYRQAKKQLEAVRPLGPFSNRALLALGWIDYKQGRSESALVSWTQLRGRSAADPAVLETLLIVPAVQRELDAIQTASQDYEAAKAIYSTELDSLRQARNSVEQGSSAALLMNNKERSRHAVTDDQQTKRFLGPMLASRSFREMAQDHGELQFMLNSVDEGLQEIDILDGTLSPGQRPAAGQDQSVATAVAQEPAAAAAVISPKAPGEIATPPDSGATVSQLWVEGDGAVITPPPREIPRLPEVESPADRPLKPLPGANVPRSRPAPRPATKAPAEDIYELYKSELMRLPRSGDFFGRPSSGDFFRRPGDIEDDDYAYPDTPRKRRSSKRQRYGYNLNQLLAPEQEEQGFTPATVPVGEALRELAVALNNSTRRMAQLSDTRSDNTDLQEQIAALRARIVRLRARIAHAIELHEAYARALALEELDRRQYLLEDLLQQASLELAKTYDQRSDQ